MGWGQKNNQAKAAPDEVENILGASSFVRGDLKAERGFRVDGKVEGSIESAGPVIIGETGSVRGDVRGSDVIVVGKVQGNVTASGHLDIGASGRVVGDVCAKSIRIETGGTFRGKSSMGDDEEGDPVELSEVAVVN
jgi:cytoskeletal protein CcmA (bactofilin family)